MAAWAESGGVVRHIRFNDSEWEMWTQLTYLVKRDIRFSESG
uniref:Uncharacterized protein n=1 Tax=Setaria digitata TaxID=48799 RepID=A0A915PXB4_9BILA